MIVTGSDVGSGGGGGGGHRVKHVHGSFSDVVRGQALKWDRGGKSCRDSNPRRLDHEHR